MAVGASQPTVVASKDGRIGMKNQMQVKYEFLFLFYNHAQNTNYLTSVNLQHL